MCACEPGYVCSRCADTPQDWRVFEDEPDPRGFAEKVAAFDRVFVPFCDTGGL